LVTKSIGAGTEEFGFCEELYVNFEADDSREFHENSGLDGAQGGIVSSTV
jgi:hypothetical protein|tara:strand:+ start:152 stop:301 length:150 start_codon:yes stop_codon:yes gene_type:complete